jgi:hypothetical protein
MSLNLDAAVNELEAMSVTSLTRKYEEVFGEACRSRHKRYLIRRIAWRLQAMAEGGLSERARQRADELAQDADIRVTAPRASAKSESSGNSCVAPVPRTTADPRLPPPGNWIERPYKGQVLRVLVISGGFEFNGERYRSLSAIAKLVTGSHINGFQFFRLWSSK